MPLFALGDDWRDAVWIMGGGTELTEVFSILDPSMKYGYTDSSPRQVGTPVIMTPDQRFSNGGVIGIPFYLPGGKDNSINASYVQQSIANTKVNNQIVGVVQDTRYGANSNMYLVLVSQDTSWISLTKIQNLFTRFRDAIGSGAVTVAGAASDAANAGWKGLPRWLTWIFENPGTAATIAVGIIVLPHILSAGAKIKSSYSEFKKS